MKEHWAELASERAEERTRLRIAEKLGISPNGLDDVDWEVVPDQNKDGFIYGYYVNFTEDSNSDVLERIGAKHQTLYLDHHEVDEDDYYDYYDEESLWERKSDSHFLDFRNAIMNIRRLVRINVSISEQFSLFVMLYMHTASSFEHLLYRCFQHEVTRSSERMKKFVETNPNFKDQKFSLSDIFKTRDDLEDIVSKYINEVIFHALPKVVKMYGSVLEFKFGDCRWMARAFLLRHDCAHRAGHTKDGGKIELSEQIILDLAAKCEEFAERLEGHIEKVNASKSLEDSEDL
jgi:hypothetical protein